MCLVKDNAAHAEISHIPHVENHDMIITRTNVIVRSLAGAVRLRIIGCLNPLHHLENITHLGGVKVGTRQYTCVFLSVFEGDVARKTLDTAR